MLRGACKRHVVDINGQHQCFVQHPIGARTRLDQDGIEAIARVSKEFLKVFFPMFTKHRVSIEIFD